MVTTHILKFKNSSMCNLYKEILFKRKKVEGRVNNGKYNKIKVGDIILLDCKPIGVLGCKVTYVNKYIDVETYLRKEGINNALGNCVKNIQEGLKIYNEYNSSQTIDFLKEKYGMSFLGIGIYLIQEYRYHFINTPEPYYSQIQELKIKFYPSKFCFYKEKDILIFTNKEGKESKRFLVNKIERYQSIPEFIETEQYFPEITSKESMLNVIMAINNTKQNTPIVVLFFSGFE